MDRLSSCYFCGTALDEPIQDYPLVAGESGEHGAVVTLCPGCHHKLETVLDVVVGEETDAPALEETDRAALEGESPAALTEPEEGSAVDPIALGDGQHGESDPERGETERSDAATEESEPAAGTDDVGTIDVTGESDDGGATDGQGSADGDAPTAGASNEPGGDRTEHGEDGAESQSGGTSPDREVTADVTALEYNKVIRLLQNREFPVERAEIETVASSAYELSEADCAAVIDLAVDRGLVAERDGRLVKPE
jgi:hypothetical protein